MTEAERIIQSGLLPSDYLKEETRNDFFVDSKRKKIWAIELEMLLTLDGICKKHGLRYYILYGTLLGAVRHKSFIPWDDDVDVGMPREDYEKLLSLHSEFESPLFLQCQATDPECFISYARIRNGNTTAISKILKYQKFNHGIFLDIFPLDNVLKNEGTARFDAINRLNIENGTYMRRTNPNLDERNRKRVEAYLRAGRNPKEDFREIQRIAQEKNAEAPELYSSLVCTLTPLETISFDHRFFASSVPLEIDGFSFSAPVGYREILIQSYGNYMDLPPVEKRGLQHSHYIFDPDKPFYDYTGL